MPRATRKEEGRQSGGMIPLLLLVMVVLQAATLYFLINPKAQAVYEGLSPEAAQMQEENNALLSEVSELTTLPTTAPVIAEVMDVAVLKNEHPVNAQVYADAQDGDKVIAYEDRLNIYREDDNQIIYDGKNPTQLAQEQYLAELQAVLTKVSALTDINPQSVPQLSTIGDVDKLRETDAEVFANAANGDNILVYTDRIIIYRPDSDRIILDAAIVDGKVVMEEEDEE